MMKHLLVLSGTGEARQLLADFASDERFRITASLAGLTDRPLALGVETRIGGFGGVEGLESWCTVNQVDAIIDLTHPYAAQISNHAAALSADLPVIAFLRPAWQANANDRWQEFNSWTKMASALPVEARPFLAGGSRAVNAFAARSDLWFLARSLKFNIDIKKFDNIRLLTGLPCKDIDDEAQLLLEYDITHVCAKNSGGEWSKAKIGAAKKLGLPIWFLRRPIREKGHRHYRLCRSLLSIKAAIEKLII